MLSFKITYFELLFRGNSVEFLMVMFIVWFMVVFFAVKIIFDGLY